VLFLLGHPGATTAGAGGEKNYAVTFPILDVTFGTFHMPQAKLPANYCIADKSFPASLGGQMLYPFRR
jgi:sterol desaturase/sphingolipid hydroxylase (fatty acid hydroxylase superfamily)